MVSNKIHNPLLWQLLLSLLSLFSSCWLCSLKLFKFSLCCLSCVFETSLLLSSMVSADLENISDLARHNKCYWTIYCLRNYCDQPYCFLFILNQSKLFCMCLSLPSWNNCDHPHTTYKIYRHLWIFHIGLDGPVMEFVKSMHSYWICNIATHLSKLTEFILCPLIS